MPSRPWHVLDLSYDARMKIVEAYADRRLAAAAAVAAAGTATADAIIIGREVEVELLDTTVEVARMLAGPDAGAAVADDGDVYRLLADRFRVTRLAPWWPTYRDVVAQLRKEVAETPTHNLETLTKGEALLPKTTLSSIALGRRPGMSDVVAETFAIACDRGLPLHAEACLPFVDVNAVSTIGTKPGTGLTKACRQGHTHVVARLLATKDINVNRVVEEIAMGTALLQATSRGHLEIVRLLLNAPGIDVNGTGVGDVNLGTPLHVAATDRHLAIMNALLDAPGINVNLRDEDGFAPIHAACEMGSTDIVERLVAVDGIDVNMVTDTGETPLMLACDADAHDLSGDALVRLLLRAGSDVNRVGTGDFRRSPLLHACFWGCSPAVVRALLDAPGVDTRWTDAEGNTAFMIAVKKKRKRLLAPLMHHGNRIDINAVNLYGETALDLARCSDDAGILPQLCKLADLRSVQLRGKGGEIDVAREVGSLERVSPYGT